MNSIELIRGSDSILFKAGYQDGWYVETFSDWLGLSDEKLGVRERPQAHGAFDVSRALRTAKPMSFTVGFETYRDQAAIQDAIDELSGLVADGPVVMRVTTPKGVSERVVTVVKVTDLDAAGLLSGMVAVDVVATDPRRYDVGVQSAVSGPAQPGGGVVWPLVWPLVWPGGGSSGRITLTNTGTAPSAPTFILSGGFDAALITCLETGARVGFDRQVPVGSSVVIDTKVRRATIDGQSDVSRWLRYREWELIPAGSSRTYQFDATGDAYTVWEISGINRVPNPSFEVNISTWTASRATLARDTFRVRTGIASVKATVTDASVPSYVIHGATAGDRISVVGGSTETMLASIYSPLAGNAVLAIYQYDAAGALLSGPVSSPNFPITASVWHDLSHEFTYLTDAASVRLAVQAPAGLGAGTGYWVDCVQLGTPGAYVDGSLASSESIRYAWTGAPHNSPSTRETRRVSASLEGQVRSAWW